MELISTYSSARCRRPRGKTADCMSVPFDFPAQLKHGVSFPASCHCSLQSRDIVRQRAGVIQSLMEKSWCTCPDTFGHIGLTYTKQWMCQLKISGQINASRQIVSGSHWWPMPCIYILRYICINVNDGNS